MAAVLPLDTGIYALSFAPDGASVVAAGSNSVPLVPAMGIAFMVCGAAALVAPAWGNWFMALGFGGVHAGFGLAIAVRHGG